MSVARIGSRGWLVGLGFDDWDSVAYFLSAGWQEYSHRVALQEPGLYAVVRDATSTFLVNDNRFHPTQVGLDGKVLPEVPNTSKPGQWRRRRWAIEALQKRWLTDADVLYLGKSDPKLKVRVGQLRNFALGRLGHTGGQVLWHLRGYGETLEIGVMPVSRFPNSLPSLPRLAEKKLLAEFRRHYGSLPYANIIG